MTDRIAFTNGCYWDSEYGYIYNAAGQAITDTIGETEAKVLSDTLAPRDGQVSNEATLRAALEGLVALYDTDEGCRSTPEYVAAIQALAQPSAQQAEGECTKQELRVQDAISSLQKMIPSNSRKADEYVWALNVVVCHIANLTAAQPVAAPSQDAWQPIETAPKDGTPVLICGGRAIWDDGDDSFELDTAERSCFFKGIWTGHYDDSVGMSYRFEPTHWMHLPAAYSTREVV